VSIPLIRSLRPLNQRDGDERIGTALSHIAEAAQPGDYPSGGYPRRGRLLDRPVPASSRCSSDAASPRSVGSSAGSGLAPSSLEGKVRTLPMQAKRLNLGLSA